MPIRVRSKPRPAGAAPAQSAPKVSIAAGAPLIAMPEPPPGRAQKPPGITLCMIVKNEEQFLDQCLRSAYDVVDEIVVVDTGSTDRTKEIAKSYGAIVVDRPWRNDFAWARNESLALATKRWILFLDADEELLAQSKPVLRALRDQKAYRHGVWVRCYNRSDDYLGTGEMSHALIRVFPNHEEIRFRGLIHEFPTIDNHPSGLEAIQSAIAIVHHGYVKDVVKARNKGERNLEIIRAATERDPDDPYNWFNLGSTAFLTGEYEIARDALERMVTILGDKPRGFYTNGLAVLAELYCDKLPDYARSEQISRRALELSPHYANAHFQLGKALVAQKRYAEAREAYLAAIDDEKYASLQFVVDDQVFRWKAHSEIGSTYVMEKDDESALVWFEKGLANAPKAEPLHINRAKSLERLGRLDEAEAAYRTVYELHGSEFATIEYVNSLLRRHKELEALEIIERAYPNVSQENAVNLLMAAAAVAQRHGRVDDERYLRAAAAISPGSAEVLDPLESLLRARGKVSELPALIAREDAVAPRTAADYLRRARRAVATGAFDRAGALVAAGLELAPENPGLRYTAALLAARSGNRLAALDELARVTQAPREIAFGAEFLRASLLRELERPDDAYASLERALAIDPNHLEALLLRASIDEARADWARVEEALTRAFAVDPGRVGVQLSSLYLRTGRFQEAAAVADRALGG
jgi:tetratricopeptide (TPR) repeat protein